VIFDCISTVVYFHQDLLSFNNWRWHIER